MGVNPIEDLLIGPIKQRIGYTFFNTALYSLIALWSIDQIYERIFKGVRLGDWFFKTILVFVVFGSSFRVLVDARIVPYTFWSTSPGIYLVVATLFFLSILFFGEDAYKVGAVFAVVPLLFLRIRYPFAMIVPILMALIPALMVKKKLRWVVFAHGLDGAATFYAMDVINKSSLCLHQHICYFEQHVLTRLIGQTFGTYFVFYLLKIVLAYVMTDYILNHIEKGRANYYAVIIFLMGLAPGLRDILRLAGGT